MIHSNATRCAPLWANLSSSAALSALDVLLSALRARRLVARDAGFVRPEAPTARKSLNMMIAMTYPAHSLAAMRALPSRTCGAALRSARHWRAKPKTGEDNEYDASRNRRQ